MKKSIISFLIGLGFSVLLLELVCLILVQTSYIPARIPSYSFKVIPRFVYDIDSSFGAWHLPNFKTRHERACFDVSYESNSYGARDVERSLIGDSNRVVVLGDSFVEGWGVSSDERFTNQLENFTGVEHLNFGASGSFGPTQYFLVYESLAKRFDHDKILIAILPDNDFKDDLPFDYERYRAYWEGSNSNYKLKYTLEHPEQSVWHPDNIEPQLSFSQILGRFSYFQNVFEWTEAIFYQRNRESRFDQGLEKADTYSGYYDYTEAEVDKMAFSINRILEEAADSNQVQLLLLPRLNDVMRYKTDGESMLKHDLMNLISSEGRVFDLLPTFARLSPKQLKSYFLSCDGHWSAEGHRFVAETLRKEFSKTLYKNEYR